ncbi:MAG: hypothetical protein KGZ25_14950, partial [Planctomycetes bacterium]|nr:hypothetical protein [Planctomycetota bacterium]
DHRFEYSYDAFNRLVSVTRKSDDREVGYYTYDAGNRRITRLARPQSGPPVATSYAYDGWQVVEEHINRGKAVSGKGKGNGRRGRRETIRTYTYGNYIDEPITMTTSRGNRTYYYHTNNLYNVRAMTDERGKVRERYRYSAYGEATILDPDGNERPESALGNPYMFQGRRLDPESALYYFRNRMMSSELGRFLQRDPVGYLGGMALTTAYFAMHGAIDPFGLKSGLTPKGKKLLFTIIECAERFEQQHVEDTIKLMMDKGGIDWQKGLIGKMLEGSAKTMGEVESMATSTRKKLAALRKLRKLEGKKLQRVASRVLDEETLHRLGQGEQLAGALAERAGKFQDALEKANIATETVVNIVHATEGSARVTASDRVRVLTSALELGDAFSNVPGIGHYIGFQTEAMQAIADGLDKIDKRITDQHISGLDFHNCQTFRKSIYDCSEALRRGTFISKIYETLTGEKSYP